MKTLNYVMSFVLLFVGSTILAQQTPGAKQESSILIQGVVAHLGNGQVIENAAIGFENGILNFVGKNGRQTGSYDQVLTYEGYHVYPGFIAANTTNGLAEIDAVRATNDTDEVGSYLPHIRSLIAYNAESKVTESLRPNGVLMGQITPRGGVISGTSSIVQFDAWNWEDAAIRVDDGIHINWPLAVRNGRPWVGEKPGPMAEKNYAKNLDQLKSYLTEAQTYLAGAQSPRNLPYEATAGLFDGTKTFYIHASGEREMLDAIKFSEEIGIKNIVLVHAVEAHKISNVLVAKSIPVIIDRAHRLPSHFDEDVHQPYKHAAMLVKSGVTVAIGIEGQMERMNARNLPFYAGTYAAYGMDKEESLKMITSNAAKILGVDDKVGTLEVGKQATLIISQGDALDMRTNILEKAFIQGRELSLKSHQTELYQRYMDKYQEEQE
ncbi:amidohydrolase [Urechidicola sp. KH5]